MRYETKYGTIQILEEKEGRFLVVSDVPFYEFKESFKSIEEAFKFFKEKKEELEEIIKKIETKKRIVTFKKGKLFQDLKKSIENGFRKILLYGPTGTGKTFGIINFLEYLKEEGKIDDYYIFTFSSGMEDLDLLGKYILKEDKNIEFKESRLIKAIREAETKKVAIVLDEFNRASSKTLNILIPLLDGRNGKVVIDNYITSEVIEAPSENVIFLFTANFGGGYSGTFRLDDAILNRIDTAIFVDYQEELEDQILEEILEEDEEKIEIVKELKSYLRNLYKEGVINPFSTRDLKNIALLYRNVRKENLFNAIEPVIYKLVKTDVFGYPEETILEEIKKFCQKITGGDEE